MLATLLLSGSWMHHAVQGQTGSAGQGMSGSWVGTFTLPAEAAGKDNPTQPIMMTYNSNGTTTEVFQGRDIGVGVGTWVSSGDRQVTQTVIHFRTDSQGNYKGTLKLRVAINLNSTLDQISGTAEGILSDLSGNVQDITGITVSLNLIKVETIGSAAAPSSAGLSGTSR